MADAEDPPRLRRGDQPRQTYKNEEYAGMFFYGYCNGDSAAARREYLRRYPNRRRPHVTVFDALYRRIRQTGNVQRRHSDAGRPRAYRAQVEEDILREFEEDPTTSTYIIAARMGLSQWKVWFTLHSARKYPYHYTPVHAIEEGDPARRLDFCRFMLNADVENPEFLKKILWTDESKFDKDGITNYYNAHYWADKDQMNPREKRVKGSQRRFTVNVWMGIIDGNLIGPHFLPDNLNGETYEDFLRNHLFPLMEDVPLATRQNMLYQHDGSPAHFRRTVCEYLDSTFPNRWIGRGGPIAWPARCPDLTPMDFYVWGHMKTKVYDVSPIPTRDELVARIIRAAEEIKINLSTRFTKSELRHRMRACIRNRGEQFEQDL